MRKNVSARRFAVLMGLIFIMGLSSAAYSNPSSNWQANQPTFDKLYSGDFENYWPILNDMKNDQCNATTDFVIGIPPGGCSPSVVRSDLLAEQNVPVFCQLYAIKVNPLIKTSSIKSISFKGDYPEGVRSVVFHPARAAVKSYSTLVGSPTLENIGYVVIILKQEKVEENMEEWVAGNLTATMRYDAEEAYGVGKGDYYLEPTGEEKWQEDYMLNSFWNGRGFLRVLDIDNGQARIQVMESKDKVLRTVSLKEGETSASSYLPGFYCKAGLKIKLNDIVAQEDMARLNVDGQDIWVREGSRFLDGKCSVRKLDVRANNDGDISISCPGAGSIAPLSLSGTGVVVEVEGTEIEKKLGDEFAKGSYIVHIGKSPENLGKDGKGFVVLANDSKRDRFPEVYYEFIEKMEDEKSSLSELEDVIDRLLLDDQGVDFSIVLEGDELDDVRLKSVGNVLSEGKFDEYFEDSVEVVRDELVEYYGGEEKETGETWAEEALYEEIVLAGKIGNFVRQKELMDLFLDKYPLAKTEAYVRDMRRKLDDTDYSNSYVNVYVGNEFKSISVVDFKSVGEGERRVDLKIGAQNYIDLNESDNVSLGSERIIRVDEILPGRAKLYFDSDKEGVSSKGVWIKEGDSEVFDGINIYLSDIDVNEVAHVSLIPDVKHEKSEADFTFRIGIEKRAIQLSPEKTEEMIRNLNSSIEEWQNIVDRLGRVVEGLKGACFATSAVLMIKNMMSGVSGEAAARQDVMEDYKVICDTDPRYRDMSRTECYNELESEIEASVEELSVAYGNVNEKMKEAQEGNTLDSGGIFGGEGIVDNEKYREDLVGKISAGEVEVRIGGEGDSENVFVSKDLSVSQLQSILLWEESADKSEVVQNIARTKMDAALRNAALGVRQNKDNAATEKKLSDLGLSGVKVQSYTSGDVVRLRWSGELAKDGKTKIEYFNYNGKVYRLVLADSGSGNMAIEEAGLCSANCGAESSWVNQLGKEGSEDLTKEMRKIVFSEAASGSCSNAWVKGTAQVRYYESGDNKGLPAIVPFGFPGKSLDDGWYVHVKNSGGTFLDDSVQGYKASGDVRNFFICNIGANGIMQTGTGDDLCQSFDVNSVGSVKDFIPCPKMDSGEVSKIYERAREAIRQASRQYGEKSINIFDEIISAGEPMSHIGGFECQDFMSASDCKLMFNVCDPVICPPSRCDFGGKWPVSDVIQTGVIGSLVLCLPNAKEGIFMPVCLSGVQAGLDAYLSILKSERDCLKHSLESGEMVGICDQITSIYKCEFFWRQMSPLMDQLIPGVIEYAVSGGRVRGGGEYALVEQSWNVMKKSVSYFKDVYAQNAFRAFNIRSTQEIGSAVCKSFVGSSVPGSADFIDNLLKPESPSQFYAQFSENLFSGATVPSTSQYKVYYHIYAGNDEGVQYRVYLKNPPASSYYATNPEVVVKSGYIAAGDAADESIDFTAPSGYKELCVVINAKEECGFKQVTSNFGLDYLSSKVVEEQALESGITTEKECISGSPSALSLTQLNLQAGVEEVANPEIAMRGVVRICASTNPDAGVVSEDWVKCSDDKDCSDKGFECGDNGWCVSRSEAGVYQKVGSKWEDVGYCGDVNLRCWLDVNSVKDDLAMIETFSGESISLLDERRGLINNSRLNLEGVAALLGKAREDIEKLTVSRSVEDGLEIVAELDKVIGTSSESGAGTNGDRAEALALKASVYRLLVGLGMENEVERGEVVRVVDDFDEVEVRTGDSDVDRDGDEGLSEDEVWCRDYCGRTGGFPPLENGKTFSNWKLGVDSKDECAEIVGTEDYMYSVNYECCCYNDLVRDCSIECKDVGYESGRDVEGVFECGNLGGVYLSECCCFEGSVEEGMDDIMDYIRGFEGSEDFVYEIDGKKHIGIGHKISSESRDIFRELFDCGEECFNEIVAGERALSEGEIELLFGYEVEQAIEVARGLFEDYDSYPVYVRKALVNAVYRGEMESGHNTVDLINEGKWREAALEYVNRVDYREAEAKGLSGIVARMNSNRDLFLRYYEELEKEVF